jgi:ubiquinone/menaquinone biosynthesis C-methylase UbiE
MSEPDSPASRFDRRASSYQDSPLQQFLFVPVQQTALRLARQLQPQARRVLDVGCGTGQLLRRARPCHPTAQLVGVDLAGQMVATARAITPTKLDVRYVHGRTECLPFTDDVFDLVFTTLSLRHWTDLLAGIAEIGRVLTPDGLRSSPRSYPAATAAVQPSPCCVTVTPSSRPTWELCWPPTAWPSSAAITPTGSGCLTSRSSQHANQHSHR